MRRATNDSVASVEKAFGRQGAHELHMQISPSAIVILLLPSDGLQPSSILERLSKGRLKRLVEPNLDFVCLSLTVGPQSDQGFDLRIPLAVCHHGRPRRHCGGLGHLHR